LIGGIGEGGLPLRDLWRFDFRSGAWHEVCVGTEMQHKLASVKKEVSSLPHCKLLEPRILYNLDFLNHEADELDILSRDQHARRGMYLTLNWTLTRIQTLTVRLHFVRHAPHSNQKPRE